MKVAVISDLHLGVGDRSDRSGHQTDKFLKFLDFLEGDFERIMLLGDIWDPMTTPCPVDPREGLRRCREAHKALSDRFDTKPYTYVHGNHDIAAGALEGAPEHFTLEADGVRLFFTHGHHHDVLVRHAPWLGDFGVWLGGWILRMRMSPLYSFVERLDSARCGLSPHAKDCSFQRWAVEKARERKVDVVVTGHTHLPLKRQHDDVLFLNSGSCAQGRFTFLSIDTKRSDYAVNTAWS